MMRLKDFEREIYRSGGESALEVWYEEMREVPFDKFEVKDLACALRQGLCVEQILPFAVSHILSDLGAGEMYDGELLASLVYVPDTVWKSFSPRDQLADYIRNHRTDILDMMPANGEKVFSQLTRALGSDQVE